MLYPICWSHSLSKEEYIPDKIVSEQRLVRIQLIVPSNILKDIAEHKLSMWAVEMVEITSSVCVDMFCMQTSLTCKFSLRLSLILFSTYSHTCGFVRIEWKFVFFAPMFCIIKASL